MSGQWVQVARSSGLNKSGKNKRLMSAPLVVAPYSSPNQRIHPSISGVSDAEHQYNGVNTRVATGELGKSPNNVFARDGVGVTAPVMRDSNAAYTPGSSERRGSTTTYMHSGIKNANAQTSTSGSVTATRTYDAFGNTVASTGTWKGPFGYAGQFGYQEDASGLKLLGNRYYDAEIGRFITKDPIKDGRNWYAYCNNNPITSYDADGLFIRPILGPEYSNAYDPLTLKDIYTPKYMYPGQNIFTDIATVQGLGMFLMPFLAVMYYKNGPWDFKMDGSQYQDYGNFHFGAIMAACGFSLDDTYWFAGMAEKLDGNSKDDGPGDRSNFPYYETWETLEWVRRGWWWYHLVVKPLQQAGKKPGVAVPGKPDYKAPVKI